MSLARRALILCSYDESSSHLIDLLTNNGYIVHLLTDKENAEKYLGKPVYIHLLINDGIGEELEKILSEVEVAIIMSPSDDLNLRVGRILRSRGVPMVLVLVRSSDSERSAEESGMIPVNIVRKTIEELVRMLKLRFTKIVLLGGSIAVLTHLITSDSRLLGRSVRDVEEEYGVRVAVVRDGVVVRDQEQTIQQNDLFIAVGDIDKLRELSNQ